MKSKKTQKLAILSTFLGFFFLIGLLYLISFILKSNNNDVLPYPHEIVYRMIELLFKNKANSTWTGIGYTLARLLIGFGVSFILGAILGTLASLFKLFGNFLSIPVAIKRSIPTAAVTIVLLGIFMGPKTRDYLDYIPCILTFIVAFPLIYESFRKGLDNEDKDIMDALRLEGNKGNLEVLFGVRYPDALPFISLGITQSLGLSFKVSIMSEVLTANSISKAGLGSLIVYENQYGTIENVIAYAVISLILMAIIDIPFIALKHNENKEK